MATIVTRPGGEQRHGGGADRPVVAVAAFKSPHRSAVVAQPFHRQRIQTFTGAFPFSPKIIKKQLLNVRYRSRGKGLRKEALYRREKKEIMSIDANNSVNILDTLGLFLFIRDFFKLQINTA